MFYSIVLIKDYKTIKGLKIALRRYENEMKANYSDIKESRSKGSKYYLGDPINIRLRETKEELDNIKAEFWRIEKNKIIEVI